MFYGWWEEVGVPGEKPHIHGENLQTPHRKIQPGLEPGTLCCEETVLDRQAMVERKSHF